MAVTWKKLAYESDVILESDYAAKGTIIAGTGAGTAGALAVGTNGYALVAASGETTGLTWSAVGTGNFLANGTVPMTGSLQMAGNQATNLVVQQVANEAAVAAYATPVVGKILFATSELTFHICTVAV